MRKPKPSMKRMVPIKAWALVDETGACKPSAYDVVWQTNADAKRLLRIRSSSAFPRHPDAKWRIARVEIREVGA